MTCYCEIFIERNGADVPVTVKARYIPAEPERGPSYASGGEPAVPAGWDILDARLADGSDIELSVAEVMDANNALFDELNAQPGRGDCELE
jgi:hypothetical protein